MRPSEPLLLEKLSKVISPSWVEEGVALSVMQHARAASRHEVIRSFSWCQRECCLFGVVALDRLVTVTIKDEDRSFTFECQCGAPQWCVHSIVVQLILCELLSPSGYPYTPYFVGLASGLRLSPLRRGQRLPQSVSELSSPVRTYRVELFWEENRWKLRVCDENFSPVVPIPNRQSWESGWRFPVGGGPVQSEPIIPPILTALQNSYPMNYWQTETASFRKQIASYIKEGISVYPLYLRGRDGQRTQLTRIRKESARPIVAATLSQGELVFDHAYVVTDRLLRAAPWGAFALDAQEGRIYSIKKAPCDVWPYMQLCDRFLCSDRLLSWGRWLDRRFSQFSLPGSPSPSQVPAASLSAVQLDVGQSAVTDVAGQLAYVENDLFYLIPVRPGPSTMDQVRLNVHRAHDYAESAWRIEMQTCVRGEWQSPSRWLTQWLLAPVSRKRARAMIRRGICQIWARGDERVDPQICVEMLSDCGPESEVLLREIQSQWERRQDGVYRLTWTGEKGMALAQVPVRQEVAVLQLLAMHVPDSAFEQQWDRGSVLLLEPTAPEIVARVIRAALDLGVSVQINEMPAASGVWECDLEVRDVQGNDWFALHPTIRCDGQEVALKQLDDGTGIPGLIETPDGFRMVGGPALQYLNTVGETDGRPRGRRRTIVEIPRLEIFDWLELRQRGVRVSLPPACESMLAGLLGFQQLEIPPLPAGLRGTLRKHQVDGYAWLCFLYAHGLSGCLADGMRVGKTLQVLSWLMAIKQGIVTRPTAGPGPHLLVVPTTAVSVWEHEAAQFFPDLRIQRYMGADRVAEWADGAVVITTYGVLARDIAKLETVPFQTVVFDEASDLKTTSSDRTGAARRLKAGCKLPVTGTPMENHLGELYSIMDLAVPGLFGPYAPFRQAMKAPQSEYIRRRLVRAKPLMLRRRLSEADGIPPSTVSEVLLELSEAQKREYRRVVALVREQVTEAFDRLPSGQASMHALTGLLRLRQVCLCPSLVNPEHPVSAPKLDYLVEQLQGILAEGYSALVCSTFTSYLDMAEAAVRSLGKPHYRIDGDVSERKRSAAIERFRTHPDPGVFFLTLKAGGRSINLQRANHVFILDPWWNPQVENQAADRISGIGQQYPMFITRIVMQHTVEEKIGALKGEKGALFDAVVDGVTRVEGQPLLTRDELEYILSFDG